MNQYKNQKSGLKGGSLRENPLQKAFYMSTTIYFLTYKGISESGQIITKNQLINYLLFHCPTNKKLPPKKHLICQQKYDSGQPHFHVILVYPRRKQIKEQRAFDYKEIHPNIQSMRNMKAALQYVHKQDSNPITNMNVSQQIFVARAQKSSTLYQLLEQQMLKDPFNFDVDDFCQSRGIFKQIYKANYIKAINLLKRAQFAQTRAKLRQKPGIKFITHSLISQNLNKEELEQFYSHPCYQKIINHINQIHQYPNRNVATMAPSKTPHLLIVGNSSIGKSALVDHRPSPEFPFPGLMHYYSCYHMSIGQKFFPPYRSFDYRMVRWNEFTIDSDLFPKKDYSRLLDYLEGAPSALPQKGHPPVQRQDNPKHILTSNRTLQQHICKTFNSQQSRRLASSNLGTRIQCVQIPPGKNLHFLRKLFVPLSAK